MIVASTVTPADGGLRLMTVDDGGAVEFSVLVNYLAKVLRDK